MEYKTTKQVKLFDNVMGNTTEECNEFLKTMHPESIEKVTPMYNTILGGVVYSVEYYFHISGTGT